MYCKKDLSSTEDQTFSFVSLGSVLQIMFNSTREDVTLKSIEIKDGKKAMSGAFHVDDNGNAVIDATDKARFQMKPSFAEELEKRWMRSGLARQHNLYFDTKDNETARRIRISRLEKEEWQCIYLAVFLKMLYLDYGSTDKQGSRIRDGMDTLPRKEQVRLAATAYNRGCRWVNPGYGPLEEIREKSRERHFHTAIVPTAKTRRYVYADIALKHFRELENRKK